MHSSKSVEKKDLFSCPISCPQRHKHAAGFCHHLRALVAAQGDEAKKLRVGEPRQARLQRLRRVSGWREWHEWHEWRPSAKKLRVGEPRLASVSAARARNTALCWRRVCPAFSHVVPARAAEQHARVRRDV